MSKCIQISLLVAILCNACQDPVDAEELLNVEDGTYIVGYISPSDTLLSVHVSTATPAVGTPIYDLQDDNGTQPDIEKYIIKDALVIISDEENNEIQLTYNPERKNYQVDAAEFSIIGGNTYFLRVSANNKEYTSTCTIPEKIKTIAEKITLREKNQYYQAYNLDLTFKDIIGKNNYYLIGGNAIIDTEDGPFYSYLNFELNSFLTDAIGDGEIIGQNSTFSYGITDEATTAKITLQVTNVEEILYLNRRATYLNNYNDGNPFVEYSIAPNNIEGENGVGVFAGYQLTEKVIEYELEQ